MKPNRTKTPREDAEVARKFDNLHKRPDTDDWEFWDMLGEIERLTHDGDRNGTKPSPKDTVSQHSVPRNHKGTPCIYKPITCQEGICSNCEIYLRRIAQ